MAENENKNLIPSSQELENLLTFIHDDLSKELPTLTIDLNYFLLGALIQKNNNLCKRLRLCMITSTIEAIYTSFYQAVSSQTLRAVKSNRQVIYDKKFSEILLAAQDEARSLNDDEVTSEHVFLAILSDTDENNKIRKVFNKAGLTYGILRTKVADKSIDIVDNSINIDTPYGAQKIKVIKADTPEQAMKQIQEQMNEEMEAISGQQVQKKKSGKNQFINTYCTDLNRLAELGKMEPLIGREKEINEIIRILGRKKKNNVILVGGEGVGKTAIGESLAYKIINGDVPNFLLDKKLISLDMTALMAGTTLRGMFEERVKGLMDEIKNDNRFVLFMDNIGAMLADKGKNDFEISAMLSRSLENGEIQVIGTSDFASYRKTFDKDPSLARRFQKIVVEAPTIEDSINILNGLKNEYEEYHNVKYEDGVIEACVKLSDKYITERNLPDSAIDILDEVGSLIGTSTEPDEIKYLRNKISKTENQIDSLKKEKNYEELDKVTKELILIKKDYNEKKELNEKKKRENPFKVTVDDILNLMSTKTGIPVSNLNSNDKKKLSHINDRLKESVIGQDDAIDTISMALKRNRIGLNNNGCMYSAMMIGRTGVGKTLIAKKLAKELFGNENALVRFDMSEFSDKVAVNKLIGSNPGYVGYEEGGQLTETIKNKKHCVLLLDEIEKADPEIYNIFLQVLDEGFLTDNSGQRVDFKNVIVLFTSNVGAKTANDFGRSIGFKEDVEANTKRILLKELKKRFPPEFLNRINDVIYFNSLTDDNLKTIISIELTKLNDRMKAINYGMTWDDSLVDFIMSEIEEEKDFGARPIIRAIQDNVENKITDELLEHDYSKNYIFTVSCNETKEVVVS
jgi:ATP-dependent Clp protease ATP-binding subunit ClpC